MKKFLLPIFLVIVVLLLPSMVDAFSFYSVSSQKFDTSLLDSSNQTYSEPNKILITPVNTVSQSLSRDPAKWVKFLYYYSITRLHLMDLPYTYLLDESGLIYQGKTGYVGANTGIENADGAILIGYLSNNPIMTVRAQSSLKEIVDDISSKWSISQIEAVTLDIKKNDNEISALSYKPATGEFLLSVKELFGNWKESKGSNLTPKAKIENLQYVKDVEVLKRTKVSFTLKNMNDFVWFTDRNPIYVATANGKNSGFAINQVWESFSRPVSISDKVILPGESIEVSFEMEAKVKVGEVKESFVLLKFNDQPFEDSTFDVVLNIVKGNSQLVEVVSPQYGFVNIRECQWYSCKILDTVDSGTVFILLEEKDAWSRVKFGLEAEGWVASRFLRKI